MLRYPVEFQIMVQFAGCGRRSGFTPDVSGINPDLPFPNCATTEFQTGVVKQRPSKLGRGRAGRDGPPDRPRFSPTARAAVTPYL